MSDAAQREQQHTRIQTMQALAVTLLATAQDPSMKAFIQQLIDQLTEAQKTLEDHSASGRPRTFADITLDDVAHHLAEVSEALTTRGAGVAVRDDD